MHSSSTPTLLLGVSTCNYSSEAISLTTTTTVWKMRHPYLQPSVRIYHCLDGRTVGCTRYHPWTELQVSTCTLVHALHHEEDNTKT